MGYKFYKMKKLILTVVFVFATGTMMNAENSSKEILNNYDSFFGCFEVADDAARMYGNARNLTHEQEHALFEYYWDRCMM